MNEKVLDNLFRGDVGSIDIGKIGKKAAGALGRKAYIKATGHDWEDSPVFSFADSYFDLPLSDAYMVLTGQVEYRTATQKELQELSRGKYKGKEIFGLAVIEGDRKEIYISEEVDKNPMLRAYVLLHEMQELKTDRPDNDNAESQHVMLDVKAHMAYQVLGGFADKMGMKGIAERAREVYRTSREQISREAGRGDRFGQMVDYKLNDLGFRADQDPEIDPEWAKAKI